MNYFIIIIIYKNVINFKNNFIVYNSLVFKVYFPIFYSTNIIRLVRHFFFFKRYSSKLIIKSKIKVGYINKSRLTQLTPQLTRNLFEIRKIRNQSLKRRCIIIKK